VGKRAAVPSREGSMGNGQGRLHTRKSQKGHAPMEKVPGEKGEENSRSRLNGETVGKGKKQGLKERPNRQRCDEERFSGGRRKRGTESCAKIFDKREGFKPGEKWKYSNKAKGT